MTRTKKQSSEAAAHYIDLEVAPRHELLELRVLLLELPKPFHVHRFKLPESLAPGVDRLLADAVLLGLLDRGPVWGVATPLPTRGWPAVIGEFEGGTLLSGGAV